MSSSLVWKPENRDSGDLPDELKYAFQKRFNFDGGGRVFDSSDTTYLQGLSDAGVKGADKLIALIEKHEAIRVWLEY